MNNASVVLLRIPNLGLRASATSGQTFLTCMPFSSLRPLPMVLYQQSSTSPYSTASWTTRNYSDLWRKPGRGCCMNPQWKEPAILEGSPRNTAWGQHTLCVRFKSTRAAAVPKRQNPKHLKHSQNRPHKNDNPPALNLTTLSQSNITEILGPAVSSEVGVELLTTLQKLRQSGRLDEDVVAPGVDEVVVEKALSWLRTNDPYDEDAAIMRRIEEEEKESEGKYLADAEKMGLYKPQQSPETSAIGKSGLDAIKEHYEKQPISDQAASAQVRNQADEIRNAAPDSALIQHPSGRAVLARRSESAEWVKRYKEKAKLDDLDFSEASWSTRLKRLFPAAIFTLTVVWFCVLLAQNYIPPPRQARLWPDMPPAAATIISLITLNAVVLAFWRIPPLWRTMNKYFLIIPAHPRVWSLLGNVFSHQSPAHYFGNMLVLWFVGTRLHDDIGRGNFIAIFIASGVFASYVSLGRFVLTNNLVTTSLGASGALTGVLAAWCSIHSGEQFKIRFLPPELGPIFSLNLLLAILITGEFIGMARGYRRIDHWAHLGGYASGFAGAQALKYRARKKRENPELSQSFNVSNTPNRTVNVIRS